MKSISAGLLMYRQNDHALEVLLVHPGGPFWKNKDDGSWTIPKGELETDEELLAGAIREFAEETGLTPNGTFIPLGQIKQKGGKTVHAWAFEGNCDPTAIKSNTFSMEWPPKSGQQQEFPEIDRAAFFDLAEGRRKINPGQIPFLDGLVAALRE